MSKSDPDTQESNECPTCGGTFANRSALGSHHSIVHGQRLLEYERGPEDRHQCPSCDRDDFASERGMKLHHKKTHGKSLAGVLSECHHCGGEFRQSRSNLEAAETHFCSEECRGEWLSPQWQGKSNPNWADSVTVECTNCSEVLERPPWHASRDQETFCSLDCLSEFQSGENSPNWKGGRFPYGKGWTNRKRERVRERDGRKCVDCGLTEAEHMDIHDEKLHVHHIVPAREFDDPEDRNAMDNLVTLCRSCHLGKWEGVPMDFTPS